MNKNLLTISIIVMAIFVSVLPSYCEQSPINSMRTDKQTYIKDNDGEWHSDFGAKVKQSQMQQNFNQKEYKEQKDKDEDIMEKLPVNIMPVLPFQMPQSMYNYGNY